MSSEDLVIWRESPGRFSPGDLAVDLFVYVSVREGYYEIAVSPDVHAMNLKILSLMSGTTLHSRPKHRDLFMV